MGKWSTATLPEGFEKRFEELKLLSDQSLHDLWEKHGSLSLGDYANMNWYWSQMNDWACIDNCEGKDAPANFKTWFAFQDTVNDHRRIRAEKISLVLASEFHMPRHVAIMENTEKKRPTFKSESEHIVYNSPTDPQFAIDFAKMHELCRSTQTDHLLNYDKNTDLWYVGIRANADDESYITSDLSLSQALQDAIEHLEDVDKRAANVYTDTSWPTPNDLKEY